MRIHWLTVGFAIGATVAGCSSTSTGLQGCAAQFPGSICLDMSRAGELSAQQAIIEDEVGAGLEVIRPLLGVSDLRIAIIDDLSGVIPETGFGGYNPSSGEVRLFADASRPDLEAVIRSQLMPTLAHEIHHAMRRRAVGYGSTLLQAAISEGLADHFSLEVSPGYDPLWAHALSEEQLSVWVPEVLARSSGGYNHVDWFIGSDSIPKWTGYAVGYELVRRYREAHSDRPASELVGEPASSFSS